jgi:hypothetical protein
MTRENNKYVHGLQEHINIRISTFLSNGNPQTYVDPATAKKSENVTDRTLQLSGDTFTGGQDEDTYS